MGSLGDAKPDFLIPVTSPIVQLQDRILNFATCFASTNLPGSKPAACTIPRESFCRKLQPGFLNSRADMVGRRPLDALL